MSSNLANKSPEERQAVEREKTRLFEFYQQNLGKAKIEAERIAREKAKRKGKWPAWATGEVDQLTPTEFQALVRRELAKL